MEAKLRSGCLDDVLVKKISVYNDNRIAIIDELQSLNIEQAVKLRNSQKSIKEIANELNFPNLSFFGKYVKQHLGTSPKQYKESSYG
ncbi:helix-turn-helix domain-containing protein [Bacteroides timonensis]|uniref:helix-turn-helix domain-containing protein n=1 Tax=Bacteroides timonensis TaxID=1470345 RepID=UPI0004B95186